MAAKDPKRQAAPAAPEAMEPPSGDSTGPPSGDATGPAPAAQKPPQSKAAHPPKGAANGDGAQAPAEPDAATGAQKGSEAAPKAAGDALARELEQAKLQAEEIYDKFMRAQAELENFKKRSQKEQTESRKYSQVPLLRDLIGIMDNLQRAVDHARNTAGEEVAPLLSGIEMVAKQLGETFERHGMERIEAKGKPFDPNLHEAMSVVETDAVPENQVMEEFQPGYLLHDRVVRPAMVTVSQAKKDGPAEPPAEQEPEAN